MAADRIAAPQPRVQGLNRDRARADLRLAAADYEAPRGRSRRRQSGTRRIAARRTSVLALGIVNDGWSLWQAGRGVARRITRKCDGGCAMNERKLFHVAWAVPATAAFLIYSLWSINRYERFGAGAWDLGCRSQSIWLLAHARGFTSSVLGNVNFMGDHFMPSLVLLAPIGWSGSPALLLAAQAA